jgi:hypothetical protein
MALEELTAESTKQDIEDYVDNVVEEVQAERAGEGKPTEKDDAQITAEHADNEHKTPVAEKKSDDKVVKPAEKEVETAQEWLDDDLKAEVAAYGIGESELADFASREELDRALRLFDKSALEAGRKAMATDANGRTHAEDGKFLKKEEREPDKVEPKKEGRHEISLSKDVYDEEIVAEFTRLRDHYESRLDALESRFHESDAKAQEQQFDGFVDSLGHADLFGKSDQEDPKQLQRRQDLHVAVKAHMLGMAQLGRPTELTESLVNRVARMVFAEDLGKKDIKNLTRKISRQSNARQGGGVTRPQDPREDPRAEAERLYKELERA